MSPMKVLGIDFTSAPKGNKYITCLTCTLEDGVLSASAGDLQELRVDGFESTLLQPGPWIAGIDFPFGQSRTFIQNIGWPATWAGYVERARRLGKAGFCEALTVYSNGRPEGSKEHQRATDKVARALSPQKLYGIPVGKMFFEGAPRLIDANVTIPGLWVGDPHRIVVEAYPAVLARKFVGKASYKNEEKRKQTEGHRVIRQTLLQRIVEKPLADYGLRVAVDRSLADDPSGDQLDALLCAIQAAWAWTQRGNGYGAPLNIDTLEGWIADPACNGSICEGT
jgi:hypothetical protein